MTHDTDPNAHTYGCYVTIKNLSAQPLIHLKYGETTGSYVKNPPSSIGAGTEINFHLQGKGGSEWPEGSEGEITYDISSDAGFGNVILSYTDPYTGSNQAKAQTESPVIRTEVYARVGSITKWGDDPAKWGHEGQVPPDGHPISILFVLYNLE